MTNKEIEKGNDLIAEFLGENRAYHTEWNLIMNVIEEIANIEMTSFKIGNNHCEITPILYYDTDSMKWHGGFIRRGSTTLEAVFYQS